MKRTTESAAQIAREHNISPQLLRNRLKKGMSIEDAVKECINVRDARTASGSAPHKSSRPGQGEIEFAGETYASFSAACQALGLRESSAYAKRKRLMDDGYSLESASRAVLEEAATRGVQRRKRTPVIINGISYDSQLEAAGALGLLRLPSHFRTPSLVSSRLTGNNSLYLSLTETISIPKPMGLGIMAKVKRFVSYSRRVILSWPIRTPPFCLLQYRPRGYRKYMNMIYPKAAVEDILISSFRHSY